jgi:hypothetical protein
MASTEGDPLPPGRVYLSNVLFWQCAGHLIGGLLPGAVLGLVGPYLLPSNPSEDDVMKCLLGTALLSLPTAFIGGLIGAVVGFRDRSPPWRLKRNAVK